MIENARIIKRRDCDHEASEEEFKWRDKYVCPNCGHISHPSSYPGYPWYDRLYFATDVEKEVWSLIKEHKPELLPEICEIRSHRWQQSRQKTREQCGICYTKRFKKKH